MIAKNIVDFYVTEERHEKKEVCVIHEANIKFELKHLVWFILGANLYETESGIIQSEMFELLKKVSTAFVDISASAVEAEKSTIVSLKITQSEASLLNNWLTARINHCTKERVANEKKFNIDTFFGMRELRLALTEIFIEVVL